MVVPGIAAVLSNERLEEEEKKVIDAFKKAVTACQNDEAGWETYDGQQVKLLERRDIGSSMLLKTSFFHRPGKNATGTLSIFFCKDESFLHAEHWENWMGTAKVHASNPFNPHDGGVAMLRYYTELLRRTL